MNILLGIFKVQPIKRYLYYLECHTWRGHLSNSRILIIDGVSYNSADYIFSYLPGAKSTNIENCLCGIFRAKACALLRPHGNTLHYYQENILGQPIFQGEGITKKV